MLCITAPLLSLRIIHQPKEFTNIFASMHLFLLSIRHLHICYVHVHIIKSVDMLHSTPHDTTKAHRCNYMDILSNLTCSRKLPPILQCPDFPHPCYGQNVPPTQSGKVKQLPFTYPECGEHYRITTTYVAFTRIPRMHFDDPQCTIFDNVYMSG